MQNKKKKLVVLFSLIMLTSFLLYSCYPDYGLSVTDYDTVITVFDENANFKQPTYAMPDTVVHLVEEGTPEDNIDRSKDQLILSTVADNMAALGYQRVAVDTTAAPPAFAILVGVTTAENYTTVWYPGYGYWGGWGWWGGYPGWGYPGGSVTYNYQTGTIFLTMIEPGRVNPDDQTFASVWLARMNGVLSSSVNSNSRIKQRINDAFNQSPYLGAN